MFRRKNKREKLFCSTKAIFNLKVYAEKFYEKLYQSLGQTFPEIKHIVLRISTGQTCASFSPTVANY